MKNSRKQKEKKGEVKTEKKEKVPKAYRYVVYIKFNNNLSIVFIGWCIYLFFLLLLYLFLISVI